MYVLFLLIVFSFCSPINTLAHEGELKEGNPRPSIFASLCFQGCNLGFKVCELQKKENPEMLEICKKTVDRCNSKCSSGKDQ